MSLHSFSKSERLCSKILINQLFAKGNYAVAQFPFRIIWAWVDEPVWANPAQVLVSVSKKNFKKSTDRNKIKRQLRELYRLHKPTLYQILSAQNKQLIMAIIYQGNSLLSYHDLQPFYASCLKKLVNQIQANAPSQNNN